jgi:hypothetical protein
MRSGLGLLAAVAALWAIGRVALAALPPFRPSLGRFARAGVSFALGCALVGAWRTLCALAGIPITAASTFLLLPAVAAAVPIARRRRSRWDPLSGDTSTPPGAGAALARALSVATALFVAATFVEAGARPLFEGDQVSIWGIKARLVHETGAFELRALPHLYEIRQPALHPPLVPMLLALVHDLSGGVDNDTAKLFFPFFLLAALGLLDAGLAPFVSPLARRFASVLLAATPVVLDNASNGLADLALCALGGGAFLLHARGDAGGRAAALLLLAGAVLTKLEGAVMAAAFVATAALVGPGSRVRRAGIAAACAVLAFVLWTLLREKEGVELPSSPAPFGDHAVERIEVIVSKMGCRLVDFGRWGPLFLFPVAAFGALRRPPVRGLLVAFGALLLVHAALYFAYPIAGDLPRQIDIHLDRALLHAALPTAALAALAVDRPRENS